MNAVPFMKPSSTEPPDKDPRQGMTFIAVVGAGMVLVITMVLGIVSLVAIFNIGKVLSSVNDVQSDQKEQSTLSACRARVSQDIQETFRKQIGEIFVASQADDEATIKQIVFDINHTPGFDQRLKAECPTPTGG